MCPELPEKSTTTPQPSGQIPSWRLVKILPSGENHASHGNHHAPGAPETHGQAVGDYRVARNLRLHKLCRSRQSLNCSSYVEGGAWHFRVADGSSALRVFLDLCLSATRIRMARRSRERELGHCGRILSLVRRDSRDRDPTHLRDAVWVASGTRHGGVGRLSLLFQDHRSPLPGRTSRTGQFSSFGGTNAGPRAWHVDRRDADGQIRLAPILHRAWIGQPALAHPLDKVDAGRAKPNSSGHHGRPESSGVSPAAFGLGNLRRSVLRQLRELFPDHLAAFLYGARATFLNGHDGEGRRDGLPARGRLLYALRLAFRPLDYVRRDSHSSTQDIYWCRDSTRRDFPRAVGDQRANPLLSNACAGCVFFASSEGFVGDL